MTPLQLRKEIEYTELASLRAIPYIPRRSSYIKIIKSLHAGTITVQTYLRLRNRLCKFYRTADISTAL